MSKILKNNNQGFSLLEILVALVLGMLMVGGAIGTFGGSPRKKIEQTVDTIERAIRFAVDEAALRNAVTRVHFYLDKSPQEITVEFGPDESFVVPRKLLESIDSSSLKETEERQKLHKSINKKFSRVKEFQENAKHLSEDIKIIAIGSGLTSTMALDSEVSIYVYPSGEKDSAIIFIKSEQELAYVSSNEFTLDFEHEFIKLDETLDAESSEEAATEAAKEVFGKWLKN